MIIHGIETSCDETAAAVLTNNDKRITILSNIIASSAHLQAKFGGVIPEQAAREQIKSIIPVIEESLRNKKIDAIAVTYGPGLIGSLLVGVETAKTLATVWKKPLIPVNHLLGHFYANWISSTPSFPAIGLLVSGGHTDLVLFKDHGKYKYLGGTRDDAAGECFDKCARLLGLPYPGGPNLAHLASQGEALEALGFKLPRPMIHSKDLDFSFSGLKTSVSNIVSDKRLTINDKQDLAAAIEQAIVDVLVKKCVQAVEQYGVKNLIVAGGVAANTKFREELKSSLPDISIFIPPVELCTDNAAMIATAAFFNYQPIDPLTLQADPNLSFFIS